MRESDFERCGRVLDRDGPAIVALIAGDVFGGGRGRVDDPEGWNVTRAGVVRGDFGGPANMGAWIFVPERRHRLDRGPASGGFAHDQAGPIGQGGGCGDSLRSMHGKRDADCFG